MIKKILLILGSLVGIGILALGGYGYYLYDSAKDTVNEMHEPIESSRQTPPPKVDGNKDELEPISILLMGVDERKNDQGRSDTMVIMTLNPQDNSMYMFSIPRDTRTEIVGRGTIEKINHAYAYGGTQMTIDTVENFLDIPINYYFKVNMESFKDIVNTMGGVSVNNSFGFSAGRYSFSEGNIHLNGDEALAYARMRKKDPRGDLGRNDRQRQIITAVINEGAQVSTITKFDDILNVLGKNIKTNMTFDEMKEVQKNYKDVRHNIETFEVKGHGQTIDKLWYYIVSDEERNQITNKLKSHLELS
ncbi:LCP family glycopolymer transferase [Pseudalkalibacillus sp. Hm43]|uniref:LCP family glycopolymer transferase n=1 Tax=Pseudalkalibacillus sp. Hm43 TaxID=3450742 RepID=UPI003F437012